MSIHKQTDNAMLPLNIYKYTKNAGNIQPHEVKNIYKKTNNQLLPIWHYNWDASEWSKCTKECEGGTQTRTVLCKRNDGVYKNDIFCEDVTKLSTEQICNQQACTKITPRSISWHYGRNVTGDRKELLGTFGSSGVLSWYATGSDMHGGTVAFRIWIDNTLYWQSANYSYLSGHKWNTVTIGWLSATIIGPPWGSLYMSAYITGYNNCCKALNASNMTWTPL